MHSVKNTIHTSYNELFYNSSNFSNLKDFYNGNNETIWLYLSDDWLTLKGRDCMSAITTNSLNSNSSNDSISPIPKGYELSTHKKDMTREEIEKAAKEAFKKM